ncbi:kelch repeat-containing protein [Chitinophaga sp. S165]|uniref:Kelch repeat-containing protein n=1 Tax=Chitinophaga sp. S165 TaxID=2135462 RepID=UPI000D71CB43|nr:kelch repeat-containing protein [Chitinophaga sp. S165]PWV55619.1 Kelch motif protein [Chitinophaga sp. S165]
MKLYCYVIGIVCLFLMPCCKKNIEDKIIEPPPPPVKQEPTLILTAADVESDNAVRIHGRIKAQDWPGAVYGIVYSADSIPTVNTPGRINLGPVSDSVDIAYTVNDLLPKKDYTFRLFAKWEDKTWYSTPKQVIPVQFHLKPLEDSFISRNTMIKIYFTERIPFDEYTGFEVYVGDKKIATKDALVSTFGESINLLVPVDYKQGTPITVKKGLYSETIVPDIPVLPGYWRKIAAHQGKIMDNAAYFTLGNKGYIVGGNWFPSPWASTNAVWEIDLATYEWKQKNPFPLAYINNAMAVVVNNKAYLFGGALNRDAGNNNYVWEYDPASDSWQNISTMPNDLGVIGRMRFATVVYNNKVYMGAGSTYNGSGTYVYYYPENWVTFDPATRKWERLPRLSYSAGAENMTAYINNNKLYVFGGNNDYNEKNGNFVLDLNDNTWSQPDITRPLQPRTGVSVITKNNLTYFFGGYQKDPETGKWASNFEFWKMDADQQYTRLASACESENVSELNRNAPIFPTANGFIVYNVFTWGGDNTLTREVIEYVAD